MTSSPLISIRPDVGSIKRLIIRRVVVLPQPDGPISATIDPSSMSRFNDDTAGVAAPSNCLETLSSLIAMEPIVLPFAGSGGYLPLRFRSYGSGPISQEFIQV